MKRHRSLTEASQKEALQTLHTVFLSYRNALQNKIFQTLTSVLIYANQETLQYFAPKSVRLRIRQTPLILFLN